MKLNKDYLQFDREGMDKAILETMLADILSGWCGRAHGQRIALEVVSDIVNSNPQGYLYAGTPVAAWRETAGLLTIEFPFLRE